MVSFQIYFSNLNEKTQKELLELVGCEDASEMNWDMDIVPLATLDFEEQEEIK